MDDGHCLRVPITKVKRERQTDMMKKREKLYG